jgi:hypothetical protein
MVQVEVALAEVALEVQETTVQALVLRAMAQAMVTLVKANLSLGLTPSRTPSRTMLGLKNRPFLRSRTHCGGSC